MRRYFLLLLATALVGISCENHTEGKPDNGKVTITLEKADETNFEITDQQQTVVIDFSATAHWHAESDAEWARVSPEDGDAGSHTLKVNIEANETSYRRTVKITLHDTEDTRITITIVQREDTVNKVMRLLGSMSQLMNNISPANYDHSDFGYHSVHLHTDHLAMLVFPCTMAERGGNTAYSRFQFANYGNGLGSDSPFSAYVWETYTTLITHTNQIIDSSKQSTELNIYEGAGHAFRALFYLDMARLYDALPATAPNNPSYEGELAAVSGLTVPIVTENMSQEQQANNPRATREEMFEFILSDLDLAEELLGDAHIDMQAMPNLAAVYALKARAYLWLGGFTESYANIPTSTEAYRLAAEYARKAITQASTAPVTSSSEWLNPLYAFSHNMPSWIWYTSLTPADVPSNLHTFAAHMCPEAKYGYGPLVGVGVSSKLYERMGENDFRRYTIAAPDATYDNFRQYTQMSEDEWEEQRYRAPYTNFKFRPGNGERYDYAIGNATSLPIIRIEEMYFIEMEATAHYDEGRAKQLLESFMTSYRNVGYTFSGGDLVEEIIFQKSAEFWGEGVVMFDMKRLNMGVNTTDANYPEGMRFENSGRLPRWNITIPQHAMESNHAINNPNPDPSNAD